MTRDRLDYMRSSGKCVCGFPHEECKCVKCNLCGKKVTECKCYRCDNCGDHMLNCQSLCLPEPKDRDLSIVCSRCGQSFHVCKGMCPGYKPESTPEVPLPESLPYVKPPKKEMVNHPEHYNHIPIECIDVIENMSFNIGTSMKYLWRVDFKEDSKRDMKKAVWYILREMYKREFVDKNFLDEMQKEFSG